ncbi:MULTISPECIES: N-acetylmuramic acid 6-phosphate etherase [Streptomyces]|uniref:N-acetylmuramic acid 6-phosphate etherase n=2 Tax=Streptomyces violaceusniger group TaxID=2839105 RepID=A0ABD5J5W8_9ACTN|nr:MULTISPECIES: N-acetylmuramic acid 6-phosphate etherase [Streptomyces]MEE4583017.1 N-acetylmuramic acid 6-phosphate etherase [Streptomyces sp. DSM 41602]KUL47251.1 N-acetylmuramic acid 6-phosphate etherase [Streptomyces violaceusniger]QTI88063.1 N-acetylmuramic acid 6-phosphate etherase [Streptomyces sp. AgN23]RSS39540.1 N-acetylmuramic acid 6-phosphate etherase [Streptomyces sp. WAC05858]WTA80359.1 N-acetylmuramic acid 6-phosphate etherase [Streptomyces antimycoticus]
MDLSTLGTETRNERTAQLDRMPVLELLSVMNAEDQSVALTVRDALPDIAAAVDAITASLRRAGRLIYLGAGTSGRIGLLDAVECPPTFGTAPDRVIGLLSGGPGAFALAVEGAEDDPARAVADLEAIGVNNRDTVVGLSASGRTPYVVGGLKHAAANGAVTVSVACNRNALVSRYADFPIEVPTGPEVLTGSTRLKAGTAEKMVCNMLSTASMVQIGKIYGNLMVDVRASNDKLVDRTRRMVAEATGADADAVAEALRAADGHAKTAIVILLAHCTAEEAARRLDEAHGDARTAVGLV